MCITCSRINGDIANLEKSLMYDRSTMLLPLFFLALELTVAPSQLAGEFG
jgi:hypothetical protein